VHLREREGRSAEVRRQERFASGRQGLRMGPFAHRAPWYIAGPLMGILITGLRGLLNKPLGALGGYIDLVDNVRRPARLRFRSFLLGGFVVGGALFASERLLVSSWPGRGSQILM